MRVIAGCIAALCLIASPAMAGANGAGGNAAADPNAAPATSANATTSTTSKPEIVSSESDLQQLKDLIDAQSKQLQQQQQILQQQQQEMDALKQQLHLGNASSGVVAGSPVVAPVAAAIGPVVGVKTAAVSSAAAAPQGGNEPASLVFKGITLTPGGFMAAESAWRQRGLGADVNSPFNTIPFPGAENAHVSEFNASGRQSRISMLVQGKLANVTVGGYYETDFLSAGVTSNNNQSNSYTLRQRQFWGQAAFTNGLTVTAGQMWSLATETKSGVSNRTEATPMTIDAQYNVGFTWARQYGFRVSKSFNNKLWLAGSVEDAETTVGVHGQSNNFLLGEAGVTSGLFNNQANYNFSASPDFIVKAVAEPGFGHYEVFGILSTFRDRVYSTFCATAPCNNTILGGGAGANARWALKMNNVDKADIGIHFLGGDGVGRYGSSGLSDVTVRPNGTLVALHSFQGLGTAELHPTSSFDFYFNVGGEYAQRAQYINGAGTIPNQGYGAVGFNNSGCWTELTPGSGGFSPTAPANCTGDTKDIFEGTAGFWHRPYKGSKGTVQWGLQYSYFLRNTWQGTGTVVGTSACATNGHPTCAPSGQDSMVFTSFRYYLP